MDQKKDVFYVGQNVVHDTDWKKTMRNNNILVCGSAGSGKTLCFTEPRLLQAFDSNLIVTVTKRKIIDKYRPVLEERGYRVTHMDFCDLEKSDVCFDPMRYISSEEDIKNLASAIYYADPVNVNTNDSFWPNISITLLQAEIALVYETLGRNGKFSDVIDLNNLIARTFHETDAGESFSSTASVMFEDFHKKNTQSFAFDNWKKFSVLPSRTAGNALSSLGVVMDRMFSKKLRDAIAEKKSVDFKSFAEEKNVLFISTSPVNTSMHSFINIFYSQAIKAFFELAQERPDGRLPIPIQMICDDFATGGKIHNFAEYISIFREAEISVMIMLQSESQLDEIYGPDNAATIINNCDTYVYLGGMDTKTMHSISLRMDLPYSDIASMKIGDEFIMRRGYPPAHIKQYDILHDPEYQRITEIYERKKGKKREAEEDFFKTKKPLWTREKWDAYIQKGMEDMQDFFHKENSAISTPAPPVLLRRHNNKNDDPWAFPPFGTFDDRQPQPDDGNADPQGFASSDGKTEGQSSWPDDENGSPWAFKPSDDDAEGRSSSLNDGNDSSCE